MINHLSGNKTNETRNILIESARIVRDEIYNLNKAKPNDFDAVIIPGGFGIAKNFSDYAFKPKNMNIQSDLLYFCKNINNKKNQLD